MMFVKMQTYWVEEKNVTKCLQMRSQKKKRMKTKKREFVDARIAHHAVKWQKGNNK